jgi:hypothetical protein
MRPIRHLSAVRLFGRRRRCSSLPVKIPTAEVRKCCRLIGSPPATTLDRVQPSGRRVGHLVLEDRKFFAVLTNRENATLSPSLK